MLRLTVFLIALASSGGVAWAQKAGYGPNGQSTAVNRTAHAGRVRWAGGTAARREIGRTALRKTSHLQPLLVPGDRLEVTPPGTALPLQLTLGEARAMVLANSRVLRLAALAVQEKRFARSAATKDYFPKAIGSYTYFHFDDFLGTVITLPFGGGIQRAVPLIEQDSALSNVMIAQPITQLLKVRQAVNLAAADERIASANVAKARRELLTGIEQLYVGLHAAQRGRAAGEAVVAGAEKLAAAQPTAENRLAELQAKQALLAADSQVSELMAQINGLLNLPLDTQLVLAEPPPVVEIISGPEQAIELALGTSPEIREAENSVAKAMAALNLAKSDFVPSVTAYGTYVNQNAMPSVQEDFGGVGVTVSHTLFEWGKKRHTLRERGVTLTLARQNLQQTREKVRLEALKAYGDFKNSEQALTYAAQVVRIHREQQPPADPKAIKAAVQARAKAEAAYLQAEVAYRSAYAELMGTTGQIEFLVGDRAYPRAEQ